MSVDAALRWAVGRRPGWGSCALCRLGLQHAGPRVFPHGSRRTGKAAERQTCAVQTLLSRLQAFHRPQAGCGWVREAGQIGVVPT